jgi:hypothetical protein
MLLELTDEEAKALKKLLYSFLCDLMEKPNNRKDWEALYWIDDKLTNLQILEDLVNLDNLKND